MQKWLPCDIPPDVAIKNNEIMVLNIAMHDITQNNFTEIWAVKDCNFSVYFHGPIKKQNVP